MSENRRFCENCGQAIGETTNFCPSCGAAQKPDPNVPTGPPPASPQPGSITTPDVGVPPPPSEARESAPTTAWRGTRLGCGLLVVLALFGIIASLFGGGEETADSPAEQGEQGQGAEQQQEAAPEPEPEPEPEEPPAAAIGETVEVGDVAWQITGAAPTAELTSEFMDPRQGNFVIVDFLFTNNADEATTLSSTSLTLLDGEGREFEPDTDTFGYIDPEQNVFLNQVNPGVTDEGRVIFTVAPGAAGFTLEVGDAAVFSDESARIGLGF